MTKADAVPFMEDGYFRDVPESDILLYDGGLLEVPPEEYGKYTDLSNIGTVVVKVGTGVMTHQERRRTIYNMRCMSEDLEELREQGKNVLVVSSGAIGLGRKERMSLGETIPERERNTAEQKQKDAEIGQYLLYTLWEHHLYPLGTSQSLVVNADLRDSQKRDKLFRGYVSDLLKGKVPIINEDDKRTLEEIETEIEGQRLFRDNDGLWALIAGNIGSYLPEELRSGGDGILGINLTTTDGIYSRQSIQEGTYKPIRIVLSPERLENEVEGVSNRGRGGAFSKVLALRDVTEADVYAVIANGQYCNHDKCGKNQPREYRPFEAILNGKVIGTRAIPRMTTY